MTVDSQQHIEKTAFGVRLVSALREQILNQPKKMFFEAMQ